MNKRISNDATIEDIISTLENPLGYVLGVLSNMTNVRRELRNRQIIAQDDTVAVRIGITGQGKFPHYRIDPNNLLDALLGQLSTDEAQYKQSKKLLDAHFVAFDGRNHEVIDRWGPTELRDDHWSIGRMTRDEVLMLRGTLPKR